jgi:hypothetical protein
MPEEAEEVDRMPGGREIEAQARCARRAEVVEVALAGPTDQAIGQERALADGARIAVTGSSLPALAMPALQELLERVLRRRSAGADAAAGGGGHAELGGDPDHDLDLLVTPATEGLCIG